MCEQSIMVDKKRFRSSKASFRRGAAVTDEDSLFVCSDTFDLTREIEAVISFDDLGGILFKLVFAVLGFLDFLLYFIRDEEEDIDVEDEQEHTRNVFLFNFLQRSTHDEEDIEPSLFDSICDKMIFYFTFIYGTLWLIEGFRRTKEQYKRGKYVGNSNPYAFCFKTALFFVIFFTWQCVPSVNNKILQTGTALKLAKKSLKKRLARKTTMFAIKNPIQMKRYVSKALNVIRWLKYLLPIIGSINKIAQNAKKFMITYRQNQVAKKVRRVKKILWEKLAPEERRRAAAIRIQSNFRKWKSKKQVAIMMDVLAVMRVKNEKEKAAIVLQRTFRRHLEKARRKVVARVMELERLKSCRLSEKEEERVQKLQIELEGELIEKRKTLFLHRPNSSFCTWWKGIMVGVILFDIFLKYNEKEMKTTKSQVQVLEHYLVHKYLPTAMDETKECKPLIPEPSFFDRIFHRTKQIQFDTPWFCEGIFASSQAAYLSVAFFVVYKATFAVAALLLLDVFVTFFTGEFDDSGTLQPQPLVKRWILGLGLKLLLHPLSKPMAKAVLTFVIHAGWGRVMRWLVTFLIPLFDILLWHTWVRLVRFHMQSTDLMGNK